MPFPQRKPTAMRCTDCSIQVPATFRVCPICMGTMWALFKNKPDEDWYTRVVNELEGIFDQATPEDIIGGG